MIGQPGRVRVSAEGETRCGNGEARDIWTALTLFWSCNARRVFAFRGSLRCYLTRLPADKLFLDMFLPMSSEVGRVCAVALITGPPRLEAEL
jgi:hypothetical protein